MDPQPRRCGRRRRLALAAGLLPALLMAAPGPASAQAAARYPDKPIRLIVPFAVGGTSDVFARLVGQKLSTAFGQQVVVENRPGANGNIGTDIVAKAEPDGYTLLFAADGTMVINPSLYEKLPFNVERDLAPVSRVVLVPLIIVANPQLKASTLPELVALGKRADADLDFSSAGLGSTGHLAGELLKSRTGIRMSHVAYKGGGQAVTDVVGGQVPLLVTALATADPFIKSGKLKAIAMTSGKRAAGAPGIPTVAEGGVPGFDVSSWYGILAPARTPAPVIEKLHAELARILQADDVRRRFQELGGEPIGDTPKAFAGVIKDDLAKWARIVKDAGISVQ
ncbi:tripartite tricarboxylate transporter substrate binding protein [Pigmentiphaga sp. H8]|uniref:Bug family tripartite tricarboxylate transporter substrate binding protein n=1 Tax=Pigmentiphaga sp. H8 TaxID=2488560 RepID=UPI000F5AC108|nr:tripartite tricarboxylate transporter substrate binding protein [Pigmentiphaga sp. H8]AZG06477.1 tripartite tricarboxylate transporter substrate binding protein [Pigmentiphaga sp. H8]